MIKREDWRELCLHKIQTIKRLLEYEEWIVAGEYMGFALECALKAVTCKTLGLEVYPPFKLSSNGRQGGEITGFRTHEFDALVVLSGLSGTLDSNFELSQFTASYTGRWEERRYNLNSVDIYDRETVLELSKLLYDSEERL